MGCNYDGGDCCGPNVNTQYCTYCECLDTGTTLPPVTTTTGNGTILGSNIHVYASYDRLEKAVFFYICNMTNF